MLWRELAELAALVVQNLLEFVDLELAQLWNGLNDSPLLIACERDAAAEQTQKRLFIKRGFWMSGRRDVIV